jgi:hypothetical protein
MLKGKCKIKISDGYLLREVGGPKDAIREKETEGYFINFLGEKMFLCWTLNEGMEWTLSVVDPESGLTICYLNGGPGDLEAKAKVYEEIFSDVESFKKALAIAKQNLEEILRI